MVLAATTVVTTALAATSSLSPYPKDLQVDSSDSVARVAKTLAAGAMSYYSGSATAYADLPAPYYWWECGALFGAMLDYSHYTQDTQYDDIIATAIMAQAGPDNDFLLPAHYGDEGNDDQAFWGFAVLSAAERNFSQPAELTPTGVPSYLDLSVNLWNNIVGRWNTTHCGGGFTWQIFASNPNGLNYKNSVSNGGFFQLSARLYHLTGNYTYAEWATRVWDWSTAIGLVDTTTYDVFDGTDSSTNCSVINQLSFSYSAGIYLYGAAVMANRTGDPAWVARTSGLLTSVGKGFFGGPTANATDVMWEHACEGVGTCNTDMKSFKAYLSRFLYATARMQPARATEIATLMQASAAAAGQACSGTTSGSTCGQRWYVGGFDGSVGLGQEMSALEAVQGLLALQDVLGTLDLHLQKATNTTGVANSTAGTSTTTATGVAVTAAGPLDRQVAWAPLGFSMILCTALTWMMA